MPDNPARAADESSQSTTPREPIQPIGTGGGILTDAERKLARAGADVALKDLRGWINQMIVVQPDSIAAIGMEIVGSRIDEMLRRE